MLNDRPVDPFLFLSFDTVFVDGEKKPDKHTTRDIQSSMTLYSSFFIDDWLSLNMCLSGFFSSGGGRCPFMRAQSIKQMFFLSARLLIINHFFKVVLMM